MCVEDCKMVDKSRPRPRGKLRQELFMLAVRR